MKKGKNLPPKFSFAFQGIKSKINEIENFENNHLGLKYNKIAKDKTEIDSSINSSLSHNQNYNSSRIEVNKFKRQTPAVAVSHPILNLEGTNNSGKQSNRFRKGSGQGREITLNRASRDNHLSNSLENIRSYTAQSNMDVIVESTAIEDSKFEQNSQNDSFWDQESNNEQNPKNSKNKYIMRNNKMMRNQKYNQYISSDIVPILNKSKLDKTNNIYLTNAKEEYSTNLSQIAKKRNKIKMNLSGKTSMNTRSSYNIMNHPSSNKYLESGNYSSKSKDQLNITHEMKSPPLWNPDTRKSHDLSISKLKGSNVFQFI